MFKSQVSVVLVFTVHVWMGVLKESSFQRDSADLVAGQTAEVHCSSSCSQNHFELAL